MSNHIELSETAKTYVTENNAHKAMEDYNDSVRYMVVGNRHGKFQVIVLEAGDYGVSIAHHGHMMVGF